MTLPRKVDKGRSRCRSDSKDHRSPRDNIREITFPFKELYLTKKVPTKRDNTPFHDTSSLIVGKSATASASEQGHELRRSGSLTGFSFNHRDRQKRQRIHSAKLDIKRKNNARIEKCAGSGMIAEESRRDRRVKSLIEQRVAYLAN